MKFKKQNPDTVKKVENFQGLRIKIDRPKGFVMRGTGKDGKPWERVYQVDYGFLPKTQGGDGEGLDVFLGPFRESTTAFWATQVKEDGSFDEYKLILGARTRKEATKIYTDHIPRRLMKSIVPISVGMVKSLLNQPVLEKTAMLLSFLSELENMGPIDAYS